jgi:hypothetical protein
LETKPSELTKKELHCIARHLEEFLNSYADKKVADFVAPCKACSFSNDCRTENGLVEPAPAFEKLFELAGIQAFHMVVSM